MHCDPGIGMPHHPHDRRQIPGLLVYAGAKVMPGRIKHKVLREAGCFPGLPELLVHCGEVSCCGIRWEYPALPPVRLIAREPALS